MTDRELLELAAKAAGIEAQWDCPERGMMVLTDAGIDTRTWNPLTDDGDALRLAVKLELQIFPPIGKPGDFATASIPDGVLNDDGNTWIQEFVTDDSPYAATRRAIVRAAAEIGKSMK